ncbi:MAG: hypothetical protein AABX30_00840 [Nanoarchaeota archaeon]
MKKRGIRKLVLAVIIILVLVLSIFLANYFNLTGKVIEAFSFKEYSSAGMDNIQVRHVISWGKGQVTPVNGEYFLIFFGRYTNHPGNDYAYYSWQGGEENNYADYEIKQEDILSFSTYTKSGSPGCGIDIRFKKSGDQPGFDLRTKNPIDQNGKKANEGNSESIGKWHKRTIVLPSDTVGRKINKINLAQIEDKDSGTFECYFDDIKITNPTTDAIATPEYNVYLNVETTKDEYLLGEKICFSGDDSCEEQRIEEPPPEPPPVEPTCTDDCTPNSRRCCAQPSNSYIQSCGNYDGDSCFEWGSCGSCSSTDPIVRCVNVRGIDKCCRYNVCY